jgi:hypothetical protein
MNRWHINKFLVMVKQYVTRPQPHNSMKKKLLDRLKIHYYNDKDFTHIPHADDYETLVKEISGDHNQQEQEIIERELSEAFNEWFMNGNSLPAIITRDCAIPFGSLKSNIMSIEKYDKIAKDVFGPLGYNVESSQGMLTDSCVIIINKK